MQLKMVFDNGKILIFNKSKNFIKSIYAKFNERTKQTKIFAWLHFWNRIVHFFLKLKYILEFKKYIPTSSWFVLH